MKQFGWASVSRLQMGTYEYCLDTPVHLQSPNLKQIRACMMDFKCWQHSAQLGHELQPCAPHYYLGTSPTLLRPCVRAYGYYNGVNGSAAVALLAFIDSHCCQQSEGSSCRGFRIGALPFSLPERGTLRYYCYQLKRMAGRTLEPTGKIPTPQCLDERTVESNVECGPRI